MRRNDPSNFYGETMMRCAKVAFRLGRALMAGTAMASVMGAAASALAGGYQVIPLVTDDQSVLATLGYGAAPTTDTALINPWDFANAGTGPWVVANAGGNGSGIVAGTATVYTGTGQIVSPTIAIPQAVGPAQGGQTGPVGPTGDVYVGGDGFTLPGGKSAQYIFDNLDGSISGWDGSSASAQTLLAGRGPGGNLAAYTGLETGISGGQTLLYAANNITDAIDVFNNALQPVTTLAGKFTDPGANPDGLRPYNIQNLDGHMWVTYAVAGPHPPRWDPVSSVNSTWTEHLSGASPRAGSCHRRGAWRSRRPTSAPTATTC
jgi:uncharacterized protein (TIGR03118 family)